MKVIGLTGGIGSGKSSASDYLRQKGYQVLDADKIAREIVMPGGSTLPLLVEAFGEEMLFDDGSLNRKKLGAFVFADPKKKAVLEKITHGEIIDRIKGSVRVAAENGNSVVFIDAPLLFETGIQGLTDEVWVVDAKEELQVERVMKRDGLTRAEVLSRMAQQLSRSEKQRLAQVVINNSRGISQLYEQLDRLLSEYSS